MVWFRDMSGQALSQFIDFFLTARSRWCGHLETIGVTGHRLSNDPTVRPHVNEGRFSFKVSLCDIYCFMVRDTFKLPSQTFHRLISPRAAYSIDAGPEDGDLSGGTDVMTYGRRPCRARQQP